jgi:hypothetical protein
MTQKQKDAQRKPRTAREERAHFAKLLKACGTDAFRKIARRYPNI